VHLQLRRPTVPWAASPAAWAQGEGADSAPLPHSAETPRESCIQLWSPQHRTDLELAQVAQRSCGCPLPGSVQGQAGWGFEHPGLVEGVPAYVRRVGMR